MIDTTCSPQHFVNVGEVYKDDAEVIAFLRSRTAPVPFGNAVRPLQVAV